MNRIFNTLISSLALIAMPFSTTTLANPPSADELAPVKHAVIQKFLAEANDNRSDLGKLLKKLNDDSKDGRNEDGTLRFPIRALDIQIVTLEASMIDVPFHYAERAANNCKGDSNESRFAIFLKTYTNGHYSHLISKLIFTVWAEEVFEKEILSKDAYSCEDEDATFSAVKTSYRVEPFMQMKPIE